jgi:enterobactin synthetase component D
LGIFELIHTHGIASEFLAIPSFYIEHQQSCPNALDTASMTRKDEFLSGRTAAATALRKIGVIAGSIPRMESGAPQWPLNSTGSIAHSSTHACAIAAALSSYRCLGLDIEPLNSMERLAGLRSMFLNDSESWCSHMQALIAFSAKEALFKMISPITGQFFGFEAAEVIGYEGNQATITLKERIGEFDQGEHFEVLFGVHDSHIVTVCSLVHRC